MMKEICAQCLQPHKDPVTGKETVVFSCFNQDQKLDQVDFGALRERLGQNSVQEKLTVALDRPRAEAVGREARDCLDKRGPERPHIAYPRQGLASLSGDPRSRQ